MTDRERERLAAELKRAIAQPRSPGPPPAQAKSVESSTEAASTEAASGSRSRPISFTPALLAAVLKGAKVQTRRPVRPAPHRVVEGTALREDGQAISPLYVAGDRLWVQEKWSRSSEGFVYERDGHSGVRWKSPRYMPKTAARVILRVTGVQLVRICAIDAAAAIAEGCDSADPVGSFLELWDSIYGEGEFAAKHDPWVWAISFELEQ